MSRSTTRRRSSPRWSPSSSSPSRPPPPTSSRSYHVVGAARGPRGLRAHHRAVDFPALARHGDRDPGARQASLELFGPGFTAGYPALAILLLGLMARASIGPVEKLLTMLGLQSSCAIVYVLLLRRQYRPEPRPGPQLGLAGAAVATSSALVVESILLFIRRKATARPPRLHMGRSRAPRVLKQARALCERSE